MNNWWPLGGKSCLLKWSQVCVYLWEGTSSSCHRNKNFKIPENFDFHNTPEVIEDREIMLKGDWPNKGRGCEHCRDQETRGGISDRMQFLQNYDSKRYVHPDLYKNKNITKIQPTQVSVNFNNKCNLKCVYCGPELSSSWVKELQLNKDNTRPFGTVDRTKGENKFSMEEPWKLDESYHAKQLQFKKWLEKNYRNLKAFDILGGEPLLQEETFETIDFMIKNPNPNLDFEIYSNMQTKPKIFREKIKKVRELASTINELTWVASIDCWGPESEYIRFGHDLKTWEENYLYILEECPEIIPTMNWSLTCLSINSMPTLMKKVIEWNKTRYSSVNINKVIDPKHFDPSIFVKGTFTKKIEEILSLHKVMCNSKNYHNYIVSMMKEIDSFDYDILKVTEYTNQVYELARVLNELDRRRGTHWKTTFPFIAENIFGKYKHIFYLDVTQPNYSRLYRK